MNGSEFVESERSVIGNDITETVNREQVDDENDIDETFSLNQNSHSGYTSRRLKRML